MDGLNAGMYYPSNFDEEKMLRLNVKRIAIETSEIYDDLSGEKGSFFENYYEDEKRGSDVCPRTRSWRRRWKGRE